MTEIEVCEKCRRLTGFGRVVEPENCLYCSGILWKLDELAERIHSDLIDYEYSTFLIGCRVEGSLKAIEEYFIELGMDEKNVLKNEIKRELGRIFSERYGKRVDFEKPDVTIIFNPERDELSYQIRPLYIYGRYRKRVRNISQTRWICGRCRGKGCEECNFTGKKYYLSVEEIIANPVVSLAKAKNGILHGSGREDVDARMLGNGRPFVLEVVEPKVRSIDLEQAERMINSSRIVSVSDLKFTDEEMIRHLKMGAFRKRYRAKVRFGRKIEEHELVAALNNLKNRTIHQRTPERVSHRRADLVRNRRVHDLKLLHVKDDVAVIEIESDAGLYIKELVSGDNGRTRPSLSEILGIEARVEKLDVLDVYDLESQNKLSE
ncbi:TIGR01213 family protein [Archaeoglobus sulfaticallidus PM70-1]|uniref:tRNA pseudouridine synthase Pus10 n=1 Tax=Archaeoglobus sulfaticallidus PM70-1 TaxID=387631 RepID=N0BEC4_9EURY|nr:tRNA pseudouridine(54/55) synthase Pus10 [Archaeoglobus sulfaticallidus]AGK60592.1 TIGR01213 family protein [Archaeoglobus sulfaticallidus PM70-1]